MSWKMCLWVDGDSVSSQQPRRGLQGSVLSWQAPSAACGCTLGKYSPIPGEEEQEDKILLERDVQLRQLLHQAAIEC